MKITEKYSRFLKDMKELHQKGMTISEIARALNIDSRRISEIFKENGIEKNIKKNILNPNEIQKQVLMGSVIVTGKQIGRAHV